MTQVQDEAFERLLDQNRETHKRLADRTPEFKAYWFNQPKSRDAINMLRDVGIWQAYEAPKPLGDFAPNDFTSMDQAIKIYQFKARRIDRAGAYEIYSVTTGEIVGHIN